MTKGAIHGSNFLEVEKGIVVRTIITTVKRKPQLQATAVIGNSITTENIKESVMIRGHSVSKILLLRPLIPASKAAKCRWVSQMGNSSGI